MCEGDRNRGVSHFERETIMIRKYKVDNVMWKQKFGNLLKRFFDKYNIDYCCFAEEYHWSTSTIRYWFIGRSLPQQRGMLNIKDYLSRNIKCNSENDKGMYDEIEKLFAEQKMSNLYYSLRRLYPMMNHFAGEILSVSYDMAKNKYPMELYMYDEAQPTGKTQVVVFDFDGTLTSGKTNKTTWERLWTSLDYDVKMCQDLHLRYDRNEITHTEWCKLTEQKFRERNLHRNMVDNIASKIKLMKGTRNTFQELQRRDIKIYIVSGSILTVIRSVLGNLYQYVDGIKANQFRFNQSGFLTEIIGTKYDFEGKASFITEVAMELNISPKDILFIGNSVNDRFAHISGARTLCINPKLTDITNRTVWNDCIQTCEDLMEIIKYL